MPMIYNNIEQKLKPRVKDDAHANLMVFLSAEDKLVLGNNNTPKYQAPQIICSMGL